MITKITGKLAEVSDDSVTIDAAPFHYEVLVADFTRQRLQGQIGNDVTLHTLQYIEGNAAQGGRLTPRLIGFESIVEREFFDLFCSVDGVGVKKALRAMVRPVADTAVLIEQQDAKGLSALPGVGPATAERVIAKLRRKMPKFALLVKRELPEVKLQTPGVVEETFEALVVLGHNEADARRLVEQAIAGGKKFKDSESMISAIYMQQSGS